MNGYKKEYDRLMALSDVDRLEELKQAWEYCVADNVKLKDQSVRDFLKAAIHAYWTIKDEYAAQGDIRLYVTCQNSALVLKTILRDRLGNNWDDEIGDRKNG